MLCHFYQANPHCLSLAMKISLPSYARSARSFPCLRFTTVPTGIGLCNVGAASPSYNLDVKMPMTSTFPPRFALYRSSCETPVMNLLSHLHKLSHSPPPHRKDKWTFKIPLMQTFLPHFTLIMSSLWPWRSSLVRHAKNCTMASISRTNSNDYLIEAFVRFPYQCRRP